MRDEFTRPEEILEELVDKTAAQIERQAPVAFDGAFAELTRYHRFLLALSASRTPDGKAFNFAEVAGMAWSPPHKEWIRQYRRLFERAADKLVDDDHFIRSLAYTPSRLLPGPDDPELSPNVVSSILDLGPMLISRLEAWVTKRTVVQTREGQSAEPRLGLAGSDSKAFADLLPDIVGAWEGLLHHVGPMYRWRDRNEQTDENRWAAYRPSWVFLWQHLTNTAYCLANAVWNEDEIGSSVFREALVRWPQALNHRLDDRAELRHRRLVFPTHLTLEWPAATAAIVPLGYEHMPGPSPDQLFATVVRGAKEDVLLLTAALLQSWTLNGKQASDIGARTARALLEHSVDDPDDWGRPPDRVSFRSLFLDLIRLELTGERFREGSYAAELDHLVATLDNMTERRIVPGRVFTPSTMHGREGLLLSELTFLLAYLPNQGDDGVIERVNALAREEAVLPEGDYSLRNILYRLRQFETTLAEPLPDSILAILSKDGERVGSSVEQLSELITAAIGAIEDARRERLAARAPDPAKLERIRAAIEDTLLTGPPQVPFFDGVEMGRAAAGDPAEWRDMVFNNISKASLVEPPMEQSASNFEEIFPTGSQEMAGNLAWNAFTRRPRARVDMGARAEEELFWRELAPLVPQVGPDPVLVVSRNAEGRALRRFLYSPAADRPNLRIEQRPRDQRRASYIATVEGVDVFGAGFEPGVAWLFSARTLKAVRYAETDTPGCFVELAFEPGEGMGGAVRIRIRQALDWSDDPVFELHAPDPEDEDD